MILQSFSNLWLILNPFSQKYHKRNEMLQYLFLEIPSYSGLFFWDKISFKDFWKTLITFDFFVIFGYIAAPIK